MTLLCKNMTLPKIFALASRNINNFDTMSFRANSTNSSITQQNNIQQHDAQLQQENQHQRQGSLPTESTPLPALMQTTNSIDNKSSCSPVLATIDSDLLVENVMPGIYLTKNFISWKKEQLRAHGFTHIIIIDKHIQELYYPNQQPDIFKLCTNSNNNNNIKRTNSDLRNSSSASVPSSDGLHDDSSSLNAFDYYCPSMGAMAATLNFGQDFEVINLNFGEKSYLTTVLPNCYKAVKFINKALQNGCSVLVIDCNGGEQKCLTIVVAYLMYKHNISFSNAFARLKEFYKKADLDRFYISQLYEYEPILQVQRAQSRGHSCSRELHAAILKRKKPLDDEETPSSLADYNVSYTPSSDLLNNCNPLMRFDATQMDGRHDLKMSHRHPTTNGDLGHGTTTYTRFMTGTTTGGWYNWEDYAME